MATKKQIGRLGEDLAKKYLIQKGYRFITANYKIPQGEVDLIFEKNEIIYFIEVKTRTNQNFGFPEEAVDEKKLERMSQAIWHFLDLYQIKLEWQIDVVSVIIDYPHHSVRINHCDNINLDY
jgi:putative endonuclease